MPDTLYVAWQDEATRRWHTIARLQKQGGSYEFVFTKGVAGLPNLTRQLFNMDSGDIYRFENLIPLFRSRMLSTHRSDYKKVAQWVGVTAEDTEFEQLCKLGLIPGSDSMLFYAAPDVSHGKYKLSFFIHAIKYMHEDAKSWCSMATPGTKLFPLLDVQNPVDPNAVALKCPKENIIVGYIPAFYARDLKLILSDEKCAEHAEICVSRNNSDAPEQLKLLCEVAAPTPEGFVPLDTPSHAPNLRVNAQINAYYDHNKSPFNII
ncbi:HIRAN domain-containing protein [Methylobacterium indicum]|uniref:Restriction endonuclease n=1 Tax=Methylobacterium indicum TaxID=1775910 RepID=A0A8H8WTR5_9HYPH|nr:HIRAN domain-containing protein [Methylobacterium indicum]BCM84103.1 restriction endonuclease [Methylobacterium indicum]